jgi:hypothetical protein
VPEIDLASVPDPAHATAFAQIAHRSPGEAGPITS